MPPKPKRAAPAPVRPLVVAGTEYRPVYERLDPETKPSGLRAEIEARNVKTGDRLWSAPLYRISYNPTLETDVQDVYVTGLSLLEGKLLARTESAYFYLFDLEKRSAEPLLSNRGGREACELHKQPHREGVAQVVYGLIHTPREVLQARQRQFPNAHSVYMAGCILQEPKKALVYYCPECREAERLWQQAHEKKTPGALRP